MQVPKQELEKTGNPETIVPVNSANVWLTNMKKKFSTSYTSQNPWTILGSSGRSILSIEKCQSKYFGVRVLSQ